MFISPSTSKQHCPRCILVPRVLFFAHWYIHFSDLGFSSSPLSQRSMNTGPSSLSNCGALLPPQILFSGTWHSDFNTEPPTADHADYLTLKVRCAQQFLSSPRSTCYFILNFITSQSEFPETSTHTMRRHERIFMLRPSSSEPYPLHHVKVGSGIPQNG
jgi:hypothetical protein